MEYWDQLAGRLEGPFVLRFVLQPLVAATFAVRAGIGDARANRAPYLWKVWSRPDQRTQLIRDGFKDVSKVFAVAIVLDVAYQWFVFRWVYPLQAVLIAVLLALVPYVLVRGPVARMASHTHH
jgi:hypothetical protein